MRERPRRQVLGLLGAAVLGGCTDGESTSTDGAASTASPTSAASPTPTASPTPGPEDLPGTIVAPEAALRDESLGLELSGFPADTQVTVEARTLDGSGRPFTAEATFRTDGDGAVDVAAQSPLDGSYDRADGMGLVWSMRPESGGVRWFSAEMDESELQVTASVDGLTHARRTVTRRYVAEGVSVERATQGPYGRLVRPSGEGPHPAVLVLHGSGGRPWLSMARMLASHGYAAFAARYFGGSGLPARLAEVPLEYFQRCIDWLRGREGVADAPVGVVGISKGGEAAPLIATYLDGVAAAVPYVGSGVAFQGVTDEDVSSWQYEGDPLPYVPYPEDRDGLYEGSGPENWREVYVRALEEASEDRLAAATTPVEEADVPFLFVSGERDGVWPSTRLSARAVSRLAAAEGAPRYEHLAYPEAGHTISVPHVPTPPRTSDYFGGTPAGLATAMADSWPRVLSFLGDALR